MSEPDDLTPRRLSIDDESLRYPLEKMMGGGRPRRASIRSIHEQSGRVPPQATDVEQSVLGAMLLEREAIPCAIEILSPDAFYLAKHQRIYLAMLSLFERGNPVDLITLTDELKRRGHLDDIGGAYYVTELTTQVASAANVEYHARIIAEKSLLRKMIETMTGLVGQAYDPGADAFELLDLAESDIFRISETQLRKAASSMNEVLKDTLARLEAIHGRAGGVTGIPSGFHRLDDLTGGWQKSDLIIIAARPSMGKCLGKGTPVMMYDGTIKPVEAIRVGDRLMGDDATPRTVRALARGREMMYWVRQRHGMDYRVNESHILSLKNSRAGGHARHGAVTNLSVRDYLCQSDAWKDSHKGYKVGVDFPEQPVPLDPYLLGCRLGGDRSVAVPLQAAAEVAVAPLHEPASPPPRGPSMQAELRWPGDGHIPHPYLANSRANRLRLLAGLIDSGGRRNTRHGATFEIAQRSRPLAEQIKLLCDTLGYRTSLRARQARTRAGGAESIVYRVRLTGNIGEIPVRLARAQTPHTDRRDWRLTGIRVEQDRVDDYYGFVLDGNRLFLLADATVTHNTAFSLACARNAALHPQYPTGVAIFSLEMSAQQLAQRLLTSEARVDAQRARTGRLSEEDWPRLARAAGRLSAAPIFIDDTPGLGILELRAKCRRLKAEHDIGLIIVDYLQLMHGTLNSRNANREQEIAHISRSLKSLAKELDVPVMALSQLSRAVETRGGEKRPQLSDLRESGCLTGDTLIPMADSGRRVPLRDLAGTAGFAVWALNTETHRLERAVVSNAFPTGTRPVYKLTTQRGRHVRATGNHKFLTLGGWKRLDEMCIGERIAVPRRPGYARAEMMAGAEPAFAGDARPQRVKPAMALTGTTRRPLHRAPASEADVYWDQIASIEPDGTEEVFDLTVPVLHNFIANDVIAHNSIEQDADVVAFIYRAERYGITVDENGNSTEGIGEIIIGKQRNGPVGDVQLAFVHQFARFENLTTYYAPGPGGFEGAPQAAEAPEGPAPF